MLHNDVAESRCDRDSESPPRTVGTFCRFRYSTLWTLVLAFILLPAVALAAPKSKINLDAQKLAKLLRPAKLSGKVGDEDLAKASARTVQVIEILESTQRSNGPPPNDLVDTAYKLFLPEVNFRRATETRQALLMAWEEARALGLFDGDGAFSRKITRGADAGKDCVFEYIVPAERVPQLSTDPINVRIVAPGKRRKGDALTAREEAYLARLKAIAGLEKGFQETAAMRRKEDLKDARQPFEGEVMGAGEAFKEVPNIILTGKKTASPSHMSQERWRITMETTNLSAHPTEVTLEVYLLGITGEKREHYLMAKHTEKLQIRAGQEIETDAFTKAEKSYFAKVAKVDGLNPKNKADRKLIVVRFRGWAARVLHEGKVVATAAPMADLLRYVEDDFAVLTALP